MRKKLMVFILLGLVWSLNPGHSFGSQCSATSYHTQSLTVALENQSKLDLKSVSVDLEIKEWDKNEILVTLSGKGPEGHKFIAKSVTSSDVKIVFGKHLDRAIRNCYSDLSATIKIPKRLKSIKSKTVSGEHRVYANLESDLQLKSVSGNILYAGETNQLEFKSVSGNVKLNKVTSSSVSIKTTSGDAEGVIIPQKIIKVRFKSVSGDLKLDLPNSLENKVGVTAKTVSGDYAIFNIKGSGKLQINSNSGNNIWIKTVSGDATVR